ncbi:hypothetical protein N1851_005236 [Merluccius polli]|uniref:Uncharacterized protein n=1 Tax=Merluccius polli TaxID=89951 RepID=A0AA47P3L9_MERPO|nr:hypothetical protein N1851_009904 [Merluccius polli]KAK0153102.1 hypothetical protein N1851_005236 [Merluccius polli]
MALGDSVLEAKKWMLVMEGNVLIQSDDLPDSSATAVLMACYFVFNIENQEEAASILEFIQRFFLRINPDGSKCTSKTQVSRTSGKKVQRKSTGLNPHVAKLIRDIVEFDWQNY